MPTELNISLNTNTETPTIKFVLTDDLAATLSGSTTDVASSIKYVATGPQGQTGETGAPGTASVTDGSITNSKIATAAVSNSKLTHNAISTANIQNNAVTTNKIANNAITANKIAPGVVTAELLADGIFTTDKIPDGAVIQEKLGDGSITTIKIAENAITKAKIAAKTLSGAEIEDNVVLDGVKIKGNAQLLGDSPAYFNGPTNDDLHIQSEANLIFKLDTNNNSNNASYIIRNGTDTTLFSVDESGNVTINGNVTITGTVDGVDVSSLPTTDTNTQLSTEQVQDIVGAMFTSNTETRVSATYDDSDGTIDIVVDDMTADTNTQLPLIDSDTMTGALSTNVASAESVKAYVDAQTHLELGTTSTTALAGDTTTISSAQASAITANTAKTGITTQQATDITTNNSKVTFPGFGTTSGTALEGDTSLLQIGTSGTTALAGDTTTISTAQANAITANTAKNTYPSADATKLAGIATGADVTTVTTSTTNADYPVVFHDSNALLDDGASDFTYNPSTNNLKIGKLTATSTGSTLAGIVSVGTTDGDDRLYIARYRDTSTIYPFAHIYAGLDGLTSRCGFKIVVRNNSGGLADGLKIDGNTKEVTFSGVINGTKLNTGQGDNELYAMNQDVQTSNSVTFASVTTTGDVQVNGNDIKDSGGNAAITFSGSGATTISDLTVPNYISVAKGITVGGAGSTFAFQQLSVKKVLSTSDCNTLHTNPVTVVPAAGANTVIIPLTGMIRVDRAATQTNSSADLNFHYDGTSGAFLNSSMVHLRRFMWNETGDRVFNLAPQAIERSQSLTEDVNTALVVSVDSALTNNCITSATIFLTYQVFDIS